MAERKTNPTNEMLDAILEICEDYDHDPNGDNPHDCMRRICGVLEMQGYEEYFLNRTGR